jgi:putative transposase
VMHRGNLRDCSCTDAMHHSNLRDCSCTDAMHRVSTAPTAKTANPSPTSSYDSKILSYKNQFGPQRKNLASLLRGFKSAVTRDARAIHPAFGWQERFHDHIIRDDNEYQRIAHYIATNPANWKDDEFYKEEGYNG